MSTPTVRPEVTSGQALGESTLASDAHSGSETSAARPVGGIKRKADDMDIVEPSQCATKICTPIKLEPGSSAQLNFKDDMEDQIYNTHQIEGTTTIRPSKIPLAAEERLAISRDSSVPVERGAETTARASPHNTKEGTNGLLRPESKPDNFKTRRRRYASRRRSKDPRGLSGCNNEDVSYESIPDYAPPISTLSADNPHILHVEWRKKSSIDLSKDPDRHLLHEAELELATNLDLSCAKYLCTKRRIFQACFEALQAGREFKRVDSQKACKIDSNKASKLCRAWERVGWFDQKYFLKYLDESNITLGNCNSRNKDRSSTASGLTEIDIWDVSESEFRFTSEGDEESTDEDTANSSVSIDGKHDETQGWQNLDSYPDTSLRRQHSRFSAVGKNGGQSRVLNDGECQSDTASPRNKTVDESPTTEDRRPRGGAVLQESVFPENFNEFSGDDNEDIPILETRSMTQKIKASKNWRPGDETASIPSANANNDQQKLSLEESYPRASPTGRTKRIPIPHSLDEACAADIMLVKMREDNRPWLEIEEAWEKVTGKAHSGKSLLCRSNRIISNIANSRLKVEDGPGRNAVSINPQLKPEDDQLLLAAEAEVETNFQREKANILAEIESNFQSEKWQLVAEAMSRTGSATYSAKSIQTQYEKLTKSKRVDSNHDNDHDTITGVPRRTTRAVGEKTSATSTPFRSGTIKLDEASNTIGTPADGTEGGRQTAHEGKSQFQIEHSARMRKVWAKRRAQGTNGHHGGPPKASTISKKAEIAAPKTTPFTVTFLAPAVTYQSGHAQESLPSPKPPVMCEQQIGRDTNQHQLSLAQIVPAAAQVKSGLDHNISSRKGSMIQKPGGVLADQTQQGAKRQTCRKCGMRYANKANHYRMLPNIGSEHRRRMAANSAAAQGHLIPPPKM